MERTELDIVAFEEADLRRYNRNFRPPGRLSALCRYAGVSRRLFAASSNTHRA